jgi:small subunit ribosomal protein S1
MSKEKNTKGQYDYLQEFLSDDEVGFDQSAESKSQSDFGAMLSESLKQNEKRLRVGEKVRGKILNLGSEEVFVTTGTRHDGVMSRRELLDVNGHCPYAIGDFIEVFVTLVKGGEIRLSKFPTDRHMAEDLKSAFEGKLPIQGRIVELCKGGVRVNIKGKIAFCPISQIDTKHIESAEEYVGKSFEFRITEISEGGKNIVVSRRKLLETERETGTASFLSETKDGDSATGRVTRLENFGAFVELAPGVEGLVHISEIAWSRIGHPSEVLVLGQSVKVVVLKREVMNGKAKISLSIKQAMPREVTDADKGTLKKDDPFLKITVGQVFQGKVSRKEPYGLFVQLEPGVTGLLHKTRIHDSKDFHFEKVRVNDAISVQVVDIKMTDRQIALGLPHDSSEDEWKTTYRNDANASLGTLGSKLAGIVSKKKS